MSARKPFATSGSRWPTLAMCRRRRVMCPMPGDAERGRRGRSLGFHSGSRHDRSRPAGPPPRRSPRGPTFDDLQPVDPQRPRQPPLRVPEVRRALAGPKLDGERHGITEIRAGDPRHRDDDTARRVDHHPQPGVLTGLLPAVPQRLQPLCRGAGVRVALPAPRSELVPEAGQAAALRSGFRDDRVGCERGVHATLLEARVGCPCWSRACSGRDRPTMRPAPGRVRAHPRVGGGEAPHHRPAHFRGRAPFPVSASRPRSRICPYRFVMLRLLPRPTFGPFSARRSRALGRRVAPAAMALLGGASAGGWRLGEPLDGRGYASVFSVRRGQTARRSSRPPTPGGAARSCSGRWTSSRPCMRMGGSTAGRTLFREPSRLAMSATCTRPRARLPGSDVRTLPVGAERDRMVNRALDAIVELQSRTGAVRPVGDDEIGRWVRGPAEHVRATLPRKMRSVLNRLEDELVDALRHRQVAQDRCTAISTRPTCWSTADASVGSSTGTPPTPTARS